MAADCLFCKIIEGHVPAKKVHEDELCVGFLDINPQAPIHALFIPRRHVATLNDCTVDEQDIIGHLVLCAAKFAREKGVSDSGYRTVMNTNSGAGQTVFHLHLHLLAGRSFTWPPG